MTVISTDDLYARCVAGLKGAGFSDANADAMAAQTVLAESLGQQSVGLRHTFDYVNQVLGGQVDAAAPFTVTQPAPSIIHADGGGGIIQGAFDEAFERMVEITRSQGLCMFVGNNATLCASLGTFPLRLAEQGLVALAATNGSPLMAGSGGSKPIFCTNPMAFSVPQSGGAPLLIDQSSSATAYVNIRAASEAGESIPEGWALDADGNQTTDPAKALDGVMLPFGGQRGANVALPAMAGEVRLDNDEILEAITDKTAIYTGGEIFQYFDPNGRTPYWDQGNLTHGTWSANGNKYCSVWPPSNAVSCYEVYRDDENQIIWIGSRGDRYVAKMVNGRKLP